MVDGEVVGLDGEVVGLEGVELCVPLDVCPFGEDSGLAEALLLPPTAAKLGAGAAAGAVSDGAASALVIEQTPDPPVQKLRKANTLLPPVCGPSMTPAALIET